MTDAAGLSLAASFDRLMRERRSLRAFKSDPVPDELLRRILATAQLAPSNCNTQPWVVHIVSGDAATRMRTALLKRATSGEPDTPDIPLTGAYPGEYRRRQIGSAVALFEATGVARDDKEARRASYLRNFDFFGAPCAAFIFAPDWAGLREIADIGMYAQSLMLALTANGLGSCPQGALSHFADLVHDQLGVPADQHLLFGMAIGWPEDAHPANSVRTDRASVSEAVTFHS